MKYLDIEEILRLHFQVIADYGGSQGVRDESRLKSLIVAPQQEVFGSELYISVHDKAAAIMRNIIGDHAFVDGNKRTAVVVAIIFMKRNGHRLTATPKELEDFAVQIAVERLEIPVIAAWLRAHSQAA